VGANRTAIAPGKTTRSFTAGTPRLWNSDGLYPKPHTPQEITSGSNKTASPYREEYGLTFNKKRRQIPKDAPITGPFVQSGQPNVPSIKTLRTPAGPVRSQTPAFFLRGRELGGQTPPPTNGKPTRREGELRRGSASSGREKPPPQKTERDETLHVYGQFAVNHPTSPTRPRSAAFTTPPPGPSARTNRHTTRKKGTRATSA